MRAAGNFSGAYVVDLSTGQVLYSKNARVGRLPASVEKLYTTSTALLRFGPSATLSTAVLGLGRMQAGTYTGTLYLRGGGDPTFGSAGFDHASYGTGATVQQLVANLISATGIRRLKGTVVADQSMFDSLRGTPATGYAPSIEVEGELGALTFNRGWANSYGSVFYKHPALEAAQQFVAALRAAGVRVPRPRIRAGVAPPGSQSLAVVHSPTDRHPGRADQRAVGQLLRRDAAQGPGRQLRRRRHDRRRRRCRQSDDRPELRAAPPPR